MVGAASTPQEEPHVRLRHILVRLQGPGAGPGEDVLEPGQDTVLDRRRRRPGDRPPRGLLPVGHERSTTDRHAPQRRHLQPRASQSGSGAGDFRGHGDTSTSATITSPRLRGPHWRRSSSNRRPRRSPRWPSGPAAARPSTSRSRAPVMPPSAARSSRSSRPTTATPAWRWPPATIGSRRSSCPTVPTSSSRCRSATSTRWSRRSPAVTWPPSSWRRSPRHTDSRCRHRDTSSRSRILPSSTARSTSPTRCRPA